MTVKIICDLCKEELVIPPGQHSMATTTFGWQWVRPASFHMSLTIYPETICDKCNQKIIEAKTNAENFARKALRGM